MILDGNLQFTGSAPGGVIGVTSTSCDLPTTTAVSTNVIDLLNARDMGIGDDPSLKLLAVVTAAFTGATSMAVAVQGCDTVGGTYVTLATGPVITEANLLVGVHLLDIDMPRMAGAYSDKPGPFEAAIPRFIKLNYVIVGTHGAGALWAGIVLDRQDWIAYPPGLAIAN